MSTVRFPHRPLFIALIIAAITTVLFASEWIGLNPSIAEDKVALTPTVAPTPEQLAPLAPISWNNTGTDFNANGSWTGGVTPGPADIATFTGAASVQPNVSSNITVSGVNFSSTASSGYNLTSSTTATNLLLNSTVTGATGAINSAITSGTNTINAPLVLNSASLPQTFTQASGGTLVLNGVISSTNSPILSFASTGTFNVNGTNTYTGTTSQAAGSTLVIGNKSAFGTNTLIFASNANKIQAGIDLTGANKIINPITWGANATINNSGTFGIEFGGNVDLNGAARTINSSISSGATFDGVISNDGGGGLSIVTANSSLVTLTGINTYTGNTTISGTGKLLVSSIGNTGVSGNVGAGTTINLGSTSNAGTLLYTGTGETTDKIINLAGTTGNATIDQSGSGLLKFTVFSATPGAGAKTLTLQGSTAGTGEIAGNIVDNSGANRPSLTKSGSGTWTLSAANDYTGATTINGGALFVTGSIAPLGTGMAVNNTGTLGGTGTILSSVTVNSGGTVAPGLSPGVLNIGNVGNSTSISFNSGSTFAVEIGGTTPGNTATNHDQLNVTGTVSLGGSTLSLASFGGFTPAGGQTFIIVNNDGADAITGTFAGLPQGSTITNFLGSGLSATITYVGGSGNDIVINVAADTTPPVITYTALANTSGTANRVLSATISDNVAVASGAVLPRNYFRKNAGAYFSTQCALVGGNAQNGTYDCTIDNSLIGGVTVGDVVGYFVIAQDSSGNVVSNPAGAVASNVNTVTTPPTPNTYTIVAQPPFIVNDGGEGTDVLPGNGVCETATGNNICTLRAAIEEANALAGSDVINFAPAVTTVNTSGSLPNITTTMSIQATVVVTVLGDNLNRVFTVTGTGNLTLAKIKVQGGISTIGAGLQNQAGGTVAMTNCEFSFNTAASAGGGIRNDGTMTITLSSVDFNSAGVRGGGIFNGPGSMLTILDSSVSFNGNNPGIGGGGISNDGTLIINRSALHGNLTGGNGGGVFNLSGTVTVTNSTVSFNSAFANNGGGIFNSLTGTVNVDNSTITDQNTAGLNGGGIFNDVGSTANVRSTIIAGNSSSTSPDVFGAFASPSFDLIGKNNGSSGFVNGSNFNIVGTIATPVDPVLGARANNGGPTQTYAVLPNSPALDSGNAFGSTTDQRGVNRTIDLANIANAADGTDIGSFERTAPTAADVSLSGRITNTNGQGIRNIRVTISGGSLTEPRVALTGSFGYFRFDGLRVSETYVVTVSGKRYVFQNPSRVVTLYDELADLDFVGLPR